MTVDWWGLGLQAINVLILVWLLGRVFWRPVAGAIARRQQTVEAMIDAGKSAQAKADARLAEVTEARADMAAERDTILAQARAAAETTTTATLTEAQRKADSLLAAAQATIDRDKAAARKENAAQASALSFDIAAKLLDRFDTPAVRASFLDLLVDAIGQMSAADRAALLDPAAEPDLVTASDIDDGERSRIAQAIGDALGDKLTLRFGTDPKMIAGMELRTPHFVLHNSWRADLDRVLKEVMDAA